MCSCLKIRGRVLPLDKDVKQHLLLIKGQYHNGIKQGRWTCSRINGLAATGQYLKGTCHGRWRSVDGMVLYYNLGVYVDGYISNGDDWGIIKTVLSPLRYMYDCLVDAVVEKQIRAEIG